MFDIKETRISAQRPSSLVWEGNDLVDWVGGDHRYLLSGEQRKPIRCSYGGIFDIVVSSPSGKYIALCTRFGTKGLIFREGKLVREINRSYYQADVYEYPLAFVCLPGGRELIAHCPDEYCRLEIEDAETGERLTASSSRKSPDIFHSRLAASADGTYLISAGWLWHPVDVVNAFSVAKALEDPHSLDGDGLIPAVMGDETSACFLPDGRVVVYLRDALDDGEEPDSGFGEFRLFDLAGKREVSVVPAGARVGEMMALGNNHVLGLYGYPKLFDLRTGQVVQEWPHIASGQQISSIRWGETEPLPVIAIDARNRRIAIAHGDVISVLEFMGSSV